MLGTKNQSTEIRIRGKETSAPGATAAVSPRNASLAIGLMSFSALLLELGLTRLFSVVLFYHFAFLAISIALLGLGAGAVFAFLRRTWLERWSVGELGRALCVANAVVIVGVLEVVLRTRVALQLDWGNFWRLTVLYLVSAVPFFVTGFLFSIVFARHTARITQLYGADLLGGSLACLALVPLLNLIGAPNTIVVAALAVALAGAAWASGELKPAKDKNSAAGRGAKAPYYPNWTQQSYSQPSVSDSENEEFRTRTKALHSPRSAWQRLLSGALVPVAVATVLLVLVVANLHNRVIDIIYAKGMKRSTPLYARWNALSRVEVDDQGWAKAIVIDADANTYIMNTDPHHWDEAYHKNLMSAASSLANVVRPHGDYAIIGPGGGVDVLRAVANGSQNVTGIEINPIIANDIMRDRFADYAHHLYEIPEVHMHVSDGRSFVRNSSDRYDVVQMTLVDTWASTAAGAFALSENNLYTVEAFREYFEHLKPDGIIAITRWEFAQPREALRVVSQAMEALRQLGMQDSTDNFIIVSDGELNSDGRPVAVLAKRSPFTLQEQRAVLNHIQGTTPQNANLNLHVLYLPATGDKPGMAHPAFAELIRGQDARAFSEKYSYNVSPVTDNEPFFFFTLKPEQVWRGGSGGIDWKVNLGIAVLGVVFIVSVVAVIAFLVLPLALSSEARSASSLRVLYFVAIGLGYILVEIAFIQRFVLFLGNPTYALTVVVFLMLLSSGAGSLLSRRWIAEPKRVAWAMALLVVALLFYVVALPHMLGAMVGLPFAQKLAISAVILVPLGVGMGMPFPSGLRALSEHRDGGGNHGAVEWAWAMNAASSVLGSVLAMVLAIEFGFNVTLACGAAAYVAAMMLLPTFKKYRVGNN
jgi:spermidine synthase